MYQRISKADKIRLVRAFRNNEDYQLLADQLGIKRPTARKIVSRAMRLENPEAVGDTQRGGAHNVKVDDEMRNVISDIIGENSASTLSTINNELRRRLPLKPTISISHLSQVCHGMFFTVKKLDACPAARNRQDVKDNRKEYARWFLEIANRSPRVVYIDESGFNIWTQRSRGRARIGERAIRTINSQRGENLTLILAVSPQHGIEHSQFHSGGTTSSVFQDFFAELSERIGHENECIFVLDNAPCHRGTIALSPDHSIKFLPPYSPMLTPVEHAFSAWKWSVKNILSVPENQQNFSDLQQAHAQGMNMGQWRRHHLKRFGEQSLVVITAEKCHNWQQHCLSYFPKCLENEDIMS